MNNTLPSKSPLGYWSVVSIGIGGMVGGGIFAVLGLAIQLAHDGAPLAFALAGLVALITAYSYVCLSVEYPSQGGTVIFINRAFGTDYFSGSLNVLLCLSYVIMLSLYAYAFGSYGASFFPLPLHALMKHVLLSFIIIVLTGLNMMGAKVVGKSEIGIVALKIAILIFFISIGIFYADFEVLKPTNWAPPLQLIAGGMIIFLAYEGFELIANAAQDVQSPKKVLPYAYYSSVIFTIILYVLIAAVTLGTLDLHLLIAARGYALAASAKTFLGDAGFSLIGIAALLSTASAINATLYGTSRIVHILAQAGQLPKFLETKGKDQPIESLLLLASLTLVIANFFDLSSIATMGSAGFLLIFAAVNLANLRLYKTTNCYRIIPLFGVITCLLALAALIWQTLETSPYNILVLLVMIILAFCISSLCRKF